MEKKALLAVFFGTTCLPALEEDIGAVTSALEAAFPDWRVARAFTSGMVRRALEQRAGLRVSSPARALEVLAAEGYTRVLVQSGHILPGLEYRKLEEEAMANAGRFARLTLGAPLLAGPEDYPAAARAVAADLPPRRGDAAVVLMGHGTDHPAHSAYRTLEQSFAALGREDVCIGTVEGAGGAEEVLARLKARPGVRRVELRPLLVVAGEHARNDMAGEGPDSWQSILTAGGFTVHCTLKGLGQYPGIREIFVRHGEEAAQ